MMGLFENFFTWQGRLNRRPHFFRHLLLTALIKLLTDVPSAYKVPVSTGQLVIVNIVVLVIVVFSFFQTIKRLHDLDLSGWYSLIALIPIVNVIAGIWVAFAKGTEGPNRFGADPLGSPTAQPARTPA